MDPTPAHLPPYSPVADWLSKFHTSSEPIQALWIVALAATVLGVAWCLTAPVRLWLLARRDRGEPRGELVYGVYRDGEGRWWLVYAEGRCGRSTGRAWRGWRSGWGCDDPLPSWPGSSFDKLRMRLTIHVFHAEAEQRRGSPAQGRG
jgi:hypothetical protein